jgi:hypothetical protein
MRRSSSLASKAATRRLWRETHASYPPAFCPLLIAACFDGGQAVIKISVYQSVSGFFCPRPQTPRSGCGGRWRTTVDLGPYFSVGGQSIHRRLRLEAEVANRSMVDTHSEADCYLERLGGKRRRTTPLVSIELSTIRTAPLNHLAPSTAAKIAFATACGCDSIATWLDGTRIAVAPIFSANANCNAAGITRSLSATTNQLGF